MLRGQDGVPYPSLHLPCVNAKGAPTNTRAAIAIGEMLRIGRFAFMDGSIRNCWRNQAFSLKFQFLPIRFVSYQSGGECNSDVTPRKAQNLRYGLPSCRL